MNLDKVIQEGQSVGPCCERMYVIAEAGVNHEGSIETAKRLIDEAAEGGADAIKFQSYKAGKIASKDSPAYWDLSLEPTKSQFELFQKYDSFWKSEYELLAEYCKDTGIEFLSTPFDKESAKFLSEMMNTFKVSSSDLNNKPFIEYICEFGKPVCLSTGASTIEEIERSVGWVKAKGNHVALLHCILSYPTKDSDANLGMIRCLQDRFKSVCIGYSDHTLPGDLEVLTTAGLLGSRIIEKHFTHDKTLRGNDHYHAMDMKDLALFREKMKRLQVIIGQNMRSPVDCEMAARKNARRSLVASKSIKAGDRIGYGDVTWKRPATGISPEEIDGVLGKESMVDIEEDTILQWDMLSQD